MSFKKRFLAIAAASGIALSLLSAPIAANALNTNCANRYVTGQSWSTGSGGIQHNYTGTANGAAYSWGTTWSSSGNHRSYSGMNSGYFGAAASLDANVLSKTTSCYGL
ncbi:hypothetical protein EV140_1458 [Microcella alkaliphila]|uniref:Lactococcin 972 family bacteriocin n=1 Tax=Microcella alkaliphila TaxID=279828 RepID=A0A4Q7TK06_9MICO|nr:hypothetical protein EV140_1458 [Microcella alkaliphila]